MTRRFTLYAYVNLEQNYLSGAFNELIRLGEWKLPNPLENMRKFTIAEKEMAWLTHKQITELLDRAKFSAKKDLSLLIRICLATGARWREAENLTRSHFSPYKVTYTRTKGKKNRSVPISKTLYKEVDDLKRDKLFDDLYFSFMALIEQTSITLPPWPTDSRSAPYVCSTLHDERGKHSGTAKNSRT